MSSSRITRVNELLRREIGDAMFHIVNEPKFDVSAVTVTHVVTSRDLRNARVLVSIRDHEDERGAFLSALKRHRSEIQKQISENIVLKYTPRLSFELDTSVEQGDHVLSLLLALEKEDDALPPPPETTN